MVPLNNDALGPLTTLSWDSGDHHLDGKKLFALAASIGLRAFYCKLFSQIAGLIPEGKYVDVPRLFSSIDRLRAVIKDPSCVTDQEDFFLGYHIRTSTNVHERTSSGVLIERTQITQYMKSFEYYVTYAVKPHESGERTEYGFVSYCHFGKYTFICTLNLDELDWGG